MTPSAQLKEELCASARRYAADAGFPCEERPSAVIFKDLAESFCAESYCAIKQNEDWKARIKKMHPQVPGACEMQSSNSSDALLMNIFCHPQIVNWTGVRAVLGFAPESPVFGLKARVPKHGTNGDETEIDLAIGNCFAEAKLTETGFTDKAKCEVEKYEAFADVFHASSLAQDNENYHNYQVIRNVLAAVHHDKNHLLLCDQRRPDLVRSYLGTIACVREVDVRRRCRVIFWQELARSAGDTLRTFLKAKYAIR